MGISALSKDPSITIFQGDKGRYTVILNPSDYHTKITSLLSDCAKWEVLKRNLTSSYKKKVIDYLQKLEKEHILDHHSYYCLYPGEAMSCIYDLPKSHKEGTPLRSIVSSINSVTYNISKHLSGILSPLVWNTPNQIQNPIFTKKVQILILPADETIFSFDVTSLFMFIPTSEAVETVRKCL